jgi:hypothetical protein
VTSAVRGSAELAAAQEMNAEEQYPALRRERQHGFRRHVLDTGAQCGVARADDEVSTRSAIADRLMQTSSSAATNERNGISKDNQERGRRRALLRTRAI